MATKKKKAKRIKRKKLESKARIRRRLMKLWTMAVHAEYGEKCAVCGSDSKPNAHHIESRVMFKGLRYDPMNGVLLCPTHHKFGKDSAHMAGCWFANWLKEHLPERYAYVLAHHADPDPDLEDREVLAAIEDMLRRHIAKYAPSKDEGRQQDNPKKKLPLEQDAVEYAISSSKPELDEVSAEEISTALDDLVAEGQCTRAEAYQLLGEFLRQKNETVKPEKENNEGNTTVQG